MVYLYRVWADNTKSFIGLYTKSNADTYMDQVGGTFECIHVKIVKSKKNAA